MKKLLMIGLLVIAVPAFAQDNDPTKLKGRWGGTVTQGQEMYTMDMVIAKLAEKEEAGEVSYPELSCTTKLTLLHYASGTFRFTERPDPKPSRTCAAGILAVQFQEGDTVKVEWRTGKSPNVLASGVLSRLTPVEAKEK